MSISDCALMQTETHSWISFPSRKYEIEGETKYWEYVHFEKEIKQRLVDAIKEKLHEMEAPSCEDEDIPF